MKEALAMLAASRTRLPKLLIDLGALSFVAVLLGTVALPNTTRAQGVYVPDDSRIQSSDPGNPPSGSNNPTVKSLGTIPIEPGGTPSHPYIPDDDSDSGDLNANHVAYGEAASNAYKAKNFSEARSLWEQAAKSGDIDALYALGVMNERGEGGPKDLEQALGWYSAAQQKGVRQASAKVTSITEELRQEAAAAEATNKAEEAAQDAADKKAAQNAAKAEAAKAAAAAKAKAQAAADAKAKAQAAAEAPPPSPPPQVTREAEPPAPPPQTAVEPSPQAPPDPPAPQASQAPTQLQPPAKTAAADPGATRPAHSDSDIQATDAFARATAAAAGRGVKKDDGEAVKWFRVAADKGYAPAQNDLGFFYAEGRGVKKDDTEAVKWYQRAVDQNYAPGQMSLGMMYAAGRGVAQSDFDALALYSSAANQGYAPATANLAQAYAQGRGIQKDERTAAFLASSVNEKPRQGSGVYVDSGS
jgi:TPR repeat protein